MTNDTRYIKLEHTQCWCASFHHDGTMKMSILKVVKIYSVCKLSRIVHVKFSLIHNTCLLFIL